MAAAECSYLPDELWERIFKIFTSLDDLDDNNCTLKSLSVVSKLFLSITNRLRFYLKITDQKVPYLQPIYIRFYNLTCLNFTLHSQKGELDKLLCQICDFRRLDLKSLILSYPNTFPAKGLLALSKKKKNLTSLTCSGIASWIDKNDLFFIADCFPLLEELILTDTGCRRSNMFLDDNDRLLALPKLRKITLSRNAIGHQSINDLCTNYGLLQEAKVIENSLL